MLKHYVEFRIETEVSGLWGSNIGTTTKKCKLSERDIAEALSIKPDGAYALQFFNRNEVTCEDGEVIYGKEKDWSPLFYIGNGPFTKEQLLESEQAERYEEELEMLMEAHYHRELRKCQGDEVKKDFPDNFVITEDGVLRPLYDGQAILSKVEL